MMSLQCCCWQERSSWHPANCQQQCLQGRILRFRARGVGVQCSVMPCMASGTPAMHPPPRPSLDQPAHARATEHTGGPAALAPPPVPHWGGVAWQQRCKEWCPAVIMGPQGPAACACTADAGASQLSAHRQPRPPASRISHTDKSTGSQVLIRRPHTVVKRSHILVKGWSTPWVPTPAVPASRSTCHPSPLLLRPNPATPPGSPLPSMPPAITLPAASAPAVWPMPGRSVRSVNIKQ